MRLAPFEVTHHRPHPPAKLRLFSYACGAREFGAQAALEPHRVVAQGDVAHPTLGGRHQQPPQRGRHDRVRNSHPGGAARVGRGCHPQLGVRALVDAAAGAVSGFIDRRAHVSPSFQFGLEAAHLQRHLVLSRRYAEDTTERARHLLGAAARQPRQGVEVEPSVRLRRERAAEIAHQAHFGVGRQARGLAAAAGAEPQGLRRLGNREKPHLRAPRPAAGAGGAAVDPGRAHGIDERPIVAAVAVQDGPPLAVRRERGMQSGAGHAVNIAHPSAAFYPVLTINLTLRG